MKQNWISTMEPLAGATTCNISKLLLENKLRVHPKYWFRCYIAIRATHYFLPLRVVERIKYHSKIKQTKIVKDPVFIIGHWRTGTTLLHSMLSRDKQFGFVTNLETYCPHFFLSFRKLTQRFVDFALPETRPMDNVKMGSKETAEEEYALSAYDKYGFYNALIFPKNFAYYSRYLSFKDCSEKEVQKWKKRYNYFLQKMTLKHNGKRLILKNPANTPRVKHLLAMFPNAKFIHTIRDPYYTFLSTLRFYRKVLPLFALQKWEDEKIKEGFIKNYNDMYSVFEKDRELIPKNNIIDVKYEDLTRNPLEIVEGTYETLEIGEFSKVKNAIKKFVKTQANYKPNIHTISNEIINEVNENWFEKMEKYGYSQLKPNNIK